MLNKLKEQIADILAYLMQVERKKLLWTNPSPTASFAPQTISLDLSKYDEIEIFYAGSASVANRWTTSVRIVKEKGTVLSAGANLLYWRYVTPSNTGINFETGYATQTYGANANVDNSLIIPYKIYGIKMGRLSENQSLIE